METFCVPGLIWTWVAVDVFALYFVEKMVACLGVPLALRSEVSHRLYVPGKRFPVVLVVCVMPGKVEWRFELAACICRFCCHFIIYRCTYIQDFPCLLLLFLYITFGFSSLVGGFRKRKKLCVFWALSFLFGSCTLVDMTCALNISSTRSIEKPASLKLAADGWWQY